MSRLSQSIAYLNAKTSDLSNEWIKTNLTDVTVNESLRELRKKYLSETRKIKKNTLNL
jgi:hypothetical protein